MVLVVPAERYRVCRAGFIHCAHAHGPRRSLKSKLTVERVDVDTGTVERIEREIPAAKRQRTDKEDKGLRYS